MAYESIARRSEFCRYIWSTEPERVTPEWRHALVTRALVMLGLSDTQAAEYSQETSSRLQRANPGDASERSATGAEEKT